ncbi:N-acetyl-gamma-glutamyl-phosphate reductase [Gorillibacterium massiliense]|uniref:N-acetyl-gamma-glutamyl-phosphate reductase n=1 Tax=Gorillibacterium massiliense TaxID=1280390 RepID=UPI0004B24C1A|nr:N-acetyl-gamma-glutamyl-phosphate reductase [Gorillibacterium massiliense]
MVKAGILGATGYAGQELVRLLHGHPEVEIRKIVSTSHEDAKFASIYRNFTGILDESCHSLDYGTVADGLDVLFTSLPYGVLMEHLTQDLLDRVHIIDLGVDYRFWNAAEFKQYYGKDHPSLHLAPQFTYGLSEWNEGAIRSARHIANPGCFATAIQLSLLPLVKEGVISDTVTVDGKCALSGSGRSLTLGTHFVEANESTKPYKIVSHPHKAESRKGIAYFSEKQLKLTFVPHIVPMQRGILVTCYTELAAGWEPERIREVFCEYYDKKPFIQLLDRGMYVETKWVRHSNMCHINFEVDEEENRLIVFAAIDNLIKGAAGQAVQNLNLMYGFPETMALDMVPASI